MRSVWTLLEKKEHLTCRADGVHVCHSIEEDIYAVVDGGKHIDSMALLVVSAVQRHGSQTTRPSRALQV